MDTKEIEKIIRIHITEFIGEKKIANNANLLDSSLGLHINDWLYIFTDLEKELKKPVCKILENMECTDFTIDCLSKPSCPTFGTTINETVQAIGY